MNLLKAAATVSSLTLLSRITGLIRDVLIARLFGVSIYTDAFWVAFRIPNLLRRLFAEGAFSQAFVPILNEHKAQKSESELRSLLDHVATLLTWILLGVTVVGVIAAPLFVLAMGSGLLRASPEGFDAAVWMTRLMFPYILCMSLIALCSAILNAFKRFALPAFSPVLLNLSMIGASLLLATRVEPPIYALAAGVMIGGVLQLLIQVPALQRLGYLPRVSWRLRTAAEHPGVQRVLRQMLPALLGVSVAQISLIINTNIATWLQPGSVSWLSFADRLMEFPSALLGVALATVLLPSLSQAHALGDQDRYRDLLDWGLRLIVLLGLPAMLGMALLAEGLVASLFHFGAFTDRDVQQTALAVIAYAAGLLGIMAVKILAPGFYARQDIRTPVRIAILILVLTQLLNLVLVPWLGHAGLALSVGLGASLNALLLLLGLKHRGAWAPLAGWWSLLLRIAIALSLMGLALAWLQAQVDWLDLRVQPWLRLAWLLGLVGGAVVLYFGTLAALGVPLRSLMRRSA